MTICPMTRTLCSNEDCGFSEFTLFKQKLFLCNKIDKNKFYMSDKNGALIDIAKENENDR